MPAEETPPMPPAADDPPLDRVSAAPPAAPSADAAAAITAGEPTPQGEASLGGEPHRRRRRRRRHPPRDLASTVAGSDPVVSPDGDESPRADVGAADPALGARVSATSPPADASNAAGDHPPHRRRRRRRRPAPGNFGTRSAPGGLGSALPMTDPAAAASADGADGPPEGTAEGETGATGAEAGDSSRARLHLRLPVPRRRRLAQPPGLPRGTAAAVPPDGDTPTAEAAAGLPRREVEFPRRQRRRRPPQRSGDGGPAGQGQRADGAPRDANRPPRGRDRNRRPGEERPRDPQPQRAGEPQRHAPGRGPRDADTGGLGRGDRAARARGPGGPRDGQRGRGRDTAPRRVEQKLYALEAMVDRGFEDVPDEAEDSGSRRVHWTIVKRTVADQKSGKAMSATYVLQREGGETEFPNLGAARAAANKTIVHPEKLTMSKAEHAAAKNSK
jgi:hypothetical protein